MKKTKFLIHLDHLLITLLACLIMLVLGAFTFTTSLMSPVAKALKNLSVTDIFFNIENSTMPADTCDIITIVDMTELTQRGDIGKLLSEIGDMNPLCIGVDLIFQGEKEDVEGNIILEEAISSICDKAVFSEKLTSYDNKGNEFTSTVKSYFCEVIPTENAYTNITDNMEKSTIRELTISERMNGEIIKSFAAKIAEKVGADINNSNKNIIINYKPTKFNVISYKEIAAKRELIDGHIVLVGTMTEETDMHLSPLGKTAGIEIQAYSLLTILEHSDIYYLPTWVNIVIGILLCLTFEILLALGVVWTASRKPMLKTFLAESKWMNRIVSMSFLGLVSIASFFVFEKYSIYIDMVVVLAMLAFVVEARILYSAVIRSLREKQINNKIINNSIF